ncbi:MAG: NADH-quinone oxidoreductase subunit H [Thermoanaerobaculaceae bacterium]|nr:NADH-quinone oxidoreductase subunit H [Thermoanaerobaculaceae bacterium]MDI9621167.1 NADH-quinone oxidoreductase subunit H [Acidobacteriota bacterium]HPW55660.1 NADH-quinone oxidoreductase subunit H [Thermoanaerobaculaceae bacterium]
MSTLKVALYLLVFPGFLFQSGFSTWLEWLDRKLYARMQNRRGPLYTGWSGMMQPVADIIKLLSKEDITPANADKGAFAFMPLLSLASVVTAGLYIPVWHLSRFNSFEGDIVVVAYLLAIPSFALFLAGWFSVSPYSLLGGTRVLTQLFAYEVPFFLALLTPAVMAGSWKLAAIAAYPWASGNWWVLPVQVIAFCVALLTLQAKLERVPFDIPEAETEVVGGPLTEYSGKKLALFRLQKDILMYVGSALVACVFLGGFGGGLWLGVVQLVVKTSFVVALLSVVRAACARIRIDQIVTFSWRWLAPASVVQFLIVLLIKASGAAQ